MKAVVFDKVGGPEVLKIAEVPKPEVKPGTVLMKVRAAGINFADTLFRQGQYMMQPQLPDTPGLEAAGEIEAVGAGVENLRPGQRVAALGSKMYAEDALAPATQVIPIPDSISFEQAAAFPVQVLTAWHMLHTAHDTRPGQTVLVHSAAGGVGIVAVQIAKAAGARVIGTVSSDSKAALAKEYGADDVINYATKDFAAEANRLTGEKSTKVSGFTLYTVAAVPDVMRRGIEESFKLIAEGKLKLLVGKSFPLAQAADAHKFMESRQSTGKLVLVP